MRIGVCVVSPKPGDGRYGNLRAKRSGCPGTPIASPAFNRRYESRRPLTLVAGRTPCSAKMDQLGTLLARVLWAKTEQGEGRRRKGEGGQRNRTATRKVSSLQERTSWCSIEFCADRPRARGGLSALATSRADKLPLRPLTPRLTGHYPRRTAPPFKGGVRRGRRSSNPALPGGAGGLSRGQLHFLEVEGSRGPFPRGTWERGQRGDTGETPVPLLTSALPMIAGVPGAACPP